MYIFLSAVIVLIAVLLILIVLIQNSKGGGLAAGFSSSNQIMGVRKTTDLLEKLTWGLTGTMVVLCIISARYAPRAENTRQESAIEGLVKDVEAPLPSDVAPFGDATEVPAAPADASATAPTDSTAQ